MGLLTGHGIANRLGFTFKGAGLALKTPRFRVPKRSEARRARFQSCAAVSGRQDWAPCGLRQDVARRGCRVPSGAAGPVTSARGQHVLGPGRGKAWRAWAGTREQVQGRVAPAGDRKGDGGLEAVTRDQGPAARKQEGGIGRTCTDTYVFEQALPTCGLCTFLELLSTAHFFPAHWAHFMLLTSPHFRATLTHTCLWQQHTCRSSSCFNGVSSQNSVEPGPTQASQGHSVLNAFCVPLPHSISPGPLVAQKRFCGLLLRQSVGSKMVPEPSCREQRRHRRHGRLTTTGPPGAHSGPKTEFGARDTKGFPGFIFLWEASGKCVCVGGCS